MSRSTWKLTVKMSTCEWCGNSFMVWDQVRCSLQLPPRGLGVRRGRNGLLFSL